MGGLTLPRAIGRFLLGPHVVLKPQSTKALADVLVAGFPRVPTKAMMAMMIFLDIEFSCRNDLLNAWAVLVFGRPVSSPSEKVVACTGEMVQRFMKIFRHSQVCFRRRDYPGERAPATAFSGSRARCGPLKRELGVLVRMAVPS